MSGPVDLAALRAPPLAERESQAGVRALPANIAKNPRLSRWLDLEQRGKVTVRTGKVELGQGVVTALAQIVAEELDVDLARIAMVRADTSTSPHEGTTTGSLSIPEGGAALRCAGAAARRLLLDQAATMLGFRRDELRIDDGRISAPGGAALDYWDVYHPALFDCDIAVDTEPKPPAAYRLVGASARRLDIPGKLCGHPSFVHDLCAPGMLFGRAVRPTRLGAALARVDETRAAALPGVQAIVRDGSFLGVLAEREEVAVEAARRLALDSEWSGGVAMPEPAALEEFLRGSVSRTITVVDEPGNLGGGRRFRAKYFRPFVAHASIGPSAAAARFDGERLWVWSHTQGVFGLRHDLPSRCAWTSRKSWSRTWTVPVATATTAPTTWHSTRRFWRARHRTGWSRCNGRARTSSAGRRSAPR